MSDDLHEHAPILIIGVGRMAGALIEGWSKTRSLRPSDFILRDPQPGPAALTAATAGATLNPSNGALMAAKTVVLAVKPQIWREAGSSLASRLAPDAVIVSIVAGVSGADLSAAFGDRPVARVMPTTAVAMAKGTASIFAPDDRARRVAHALFDPIAVTVDLETEGDMDAVTAVSGSAPAYLYAFIESLEAAAARQGLDRRTAERLIRSTIIGAAAMLEHSTEEPAALRRQVTSSGGTTEAALHVLCKDGGLGDLVGQAVEAAVVRSRALGQGAVA